MVLTHDLGSLRFIVVGYLCVGNVVRLGFQLTVRCMLVGDREAKSGFSILLHRLGSLLRKKCTIKIMVLSITSRGIQRLMYLRLTLLLKFSPKTDGLIL